MCNGGTSILGGDGIVYNISEKHDNMIANQKCRVLRQHTCSAWLSPTRRVCPNMAVRGRYTFSHIFVQFFLKFSLFVTNKKAVHFPPDIFPYKVVRVQFPELIELFVQFFGYHKKTAITSEGLLSLITMPMAPHFNLGISAQVYFVRFSNSL